MSPTVKVEKRRLYQQEREQAKGALRALEVPDGPWLVRMKGTRRMTHMVRARRASRRGQDGVPHREQPSATDAGVCADGGDTGWRGGVQDMLASGA